VVAGVLTVQKVNANRRHRWVGTKVENIRELKTQHILGERQGGVKVWCWQDGMTQAHVTGDEPRHPLGRHKRQAIGAMTPAQLMTVARRVGDLDQRLYTALLDLDRRARLPFDAGGAQVLECRLEGRLVGQLPSGSQITRLAPFDDQHTKRTLVHLHVQATTWGRLHLHAQHVFGVTLPMTEVFDLRDEIAQTANVDHALVLVG